MQRSLEIRVVTSSQFQPLTESMKTKIFSRCFGQLADGTSSGGHQAGKSWPTLVQDLREIISLHKALLRSRISQGLPDPLYCHLITKIFEGSLHWWSVMAQRRISWFTRSHAFSACDPKPVELPPSRDQVGTSSLLNLQGLWLRTVLRNAND